MTDDQRDRASSILYELDRIARDFDHHEFGLPVGNQEPFDQMIAAIAPDIADRPEEDGEPLTAEWLESVGFAKGSAPAGNTLWLKTIETEQHTDGVSWTRLRVHESDDRGHWPTEVLQGIDGRLGNAIAVLLNRKTTRGDLRRLCEAMGWPLTVPTREGS